MADKEPTEEELLEAIERVGRALDFEDLKREIPEPGEREEEK